MSKKHFTKMKNFDLILKHFCETCCDKQHKWYLKQRWKESFNQWFWWKILKKVQTKKKIK